MKAAILCLVLGAAMTATVAAPALRFLPSVLAARLHDLALPLHPSRLA